MVLVIHFPEEYEKEKTNFIVEKLNKYYLNWVIKVNISSDKVILIVCMMERAFQLHNIL